MKIQYLVLLCVLFLGTQSCNPMEGFKPFKVANDGSEDFDIFVYVKESMGFGACDVKVFAKSGGEQEKTLVLSQKLYNDGASLGMNNIKIDWLAQKVALVTLDGQEQAAKSYRITHTGTGKYTTKEE